MPARRKAPRVRLTISCLDSEWERIREIAARRGVSINDHAVSAGLSVELSPPRDAPALALSEAEQRRLTAGAPCPENPSPFNLPTQTPPTSNPGTAARRTQFRARIKSTDKLRIR